MNLKKFTITDECIGCMACVGISEANFQMNDQNKAFVIKQPENKEEEQLCEEAAEACPVGAIIELKQTEKTIEPILATNNIKETLDKYPQLKQVLENLSPKFRRMRNPILYNTLARFANFEDAAKMTGVSLCEILHTINKFLGVEHKLIEKMPECIEKRTEQTVDLQGEPITWQESNERYIFNQEIIDQLIERISKLKPQQNIVIYSVEPPEILLKVVKGLNFKYNLSKDRDYRLSVFNPEQKTIQKSWKDKKDTFEQLDVRNLPSDPFDIIIKKAYQIPEGEGFVLIQSFIPYPIINMLTEMDFDSEIEVVDNQTVKVYFYKKPTEKKTISLSKKIEVVLQSATPVAYPILMKLLQSEALRKEIRIKQLKVWSETEKHLGWIINKKADISFSAVITSLRLKKADVKFPAVVVWDNFVLLTRNYKAKDFSDLKGKKIYLPLFMEAPPAKITRYLIKASGLNPDDFIFKFGKPFGRPEIIYRDFVLGKIDTAVLREPEASFAVKILEDQGIQFSEISYNELWNKVNKGFGSFPNAGVVFKGEFYRKYPEIVQLFLDELKKTIDWINNNPKQAAKMSFDIMRQPIDRIEKFLSRVHFEYQDGDKLIEKMQKYFDVLTKEKIIEGIADKQFFEIFRI